MSRTIRVDHLARVEGHGGITVELEGDAVTDVRFDVFEGARLLEALVRGRSYVEVAPIVSRICAICSVAHALTSLKATEAAFGVEVSPQTELLRDLLFRGENIESHALHLFLLAAPDYLHYPSAIAMAAEHAEAVRLALRLKKLGNTIQETVGGRAVHPVNAVPGGFGRAPSEDQLISLRRDLLEGVADCQAALEWLAALPAVEVCRDQTAYAALQSAGQYGYYGGDSVAVAWNGTLDNIAAADYRSLTCERAVPHSHAKHSTYRGRPFMVGALARLALNGSKLQGGSRRALERLAVRLPSDDPLDNNKAQAVELVFDVDYALGVVERLLERGAADEPPVPVRPRAGTGAAVTEAPRGLLVHCYTYAEDGALLAADVITPTAMNAASLEQRFRRAVEQSPERDTAALTRRLEMIARAYDPCISCSVHLVRKRHAG
jgi:sulfhydrogenase subunit alpha